MKDVSAILQTHFENVKAAGSGWMARCPAHDDKHNSLSLATGDDGRLLLKCHAGCSTEIVILRAGLTWADILPDRQEEKVEVTSYQYRDEREKVLYEVVRFFPKDFRQRRPDPEAPSKWIWRLDQVRRVPYRLPELIATPKDHIVYIVEGEKDADLMSMRGYPTTTASGGAGKWVDSHSEFFEGRTVVILPDNDKPGREHAEVVKKSLLAYRTAHVEVCRLPGLPEKGDVSDWFCTLGNTTEMFDEFIRGVFDEAGSERSAIIEEHSIHSQEARDKEFWTPTELVENSSIVFPDGFLHGEIFPRGTVSMIYGASSSGKSYLVMYLGAQIALHRTVHGLDTSPGRVLFLSEEMGLPEMKLRSEIVWDRETRTALRERMMNRFFSGFDFGGKERDNPSIHKFFDICKRAKPDIVFIDSLTKIHHEEENSNPRMGQVMQNLEAAARQTNTALVLVHHTAKANPESERSGKDKARGASSIMAAMNDALLVECISPKDLKSVVKFEKTRSIIGSPPPPFLFTQEQDPSGRTVKVKNKTVTAVQFLIGDYVKKDRVEDEAMRDVRSSLEGLVGERMEEGSTTDEVSRMDLIVRLKTENPEWSDNRCDQAITRAVVRKLIERRGRGTYGPAKN